MSSQEFNRDMVSASHKLYARGLVANHDGNITFKLDGGRFLATPTAMSKGDVTEKDLLIIDGDGKVISGQHKVFSEISWHLAVYRARPDILCVVHAHPPIASGMALAGREIGTPALPEAIVSLGRAILNTESFSPADPALITKLEAEVKRCLAESDGFLSPGNGAWSVGQNILQTYYRMELIEHVAHQHYVAAKMGELHRLPSATVEEILKRRSKIAPTTALASSPFAAAPAASLGRQASSPKSPAPVIDFDQLRAVVADELKKILR